MQLIKFIASCRVDLREKSLFVLTHLFQEIALAIVRRICGRANLIQEWVYFTRESPNYNGQKKVIRHNTIYSISKHTLSCASVTSEINIRLYGSEYVKNHTVKSPICPLPLLPTLRF